MKGSVAATAAIVAGAYAQGGYPVSYSTVTIDECPSSSYQSMITVTDGVTVTYCPECEGPPPTGMPTGPPGPPPPGHTTVYTTVYDEYCTTGSTMKPHTYTVTESCSEATPTWTPGPSHIPEGFTTTVITCHSCTDHPIDVTVTQPCDCEATSGVPVGPPPPPPTGGAGPPPPPGPPPTGGPPASPASTPCPGCVTQISDGQVQAPTGTPPGPPAPPAGGPPPPPPAGPSGGAPPPAPPAGGKPPAPPAPPVSTPCKSCVSQISDGQPQAPTGMATSPMPQGPSTATVAHCPGGTACANPPITPYQGAAARFGTVSYSVVALSIGVLAVAL